MGLRNFLLCTYFITSFSIAYSQVQEIKWLSFAQLEDSLTVKPKKVFIDFYADWCAYCKKMDKAAYSDPKVIALLNADYYAVKMNTESRDSIVFGGDIFYNKEFGQKRNPVHQIPLLLASRDERPFTLPAIVIMNEKFQVIKRYFEYIPPKKMLKLLE